VLLTGALVRRVGYPCVPDIVSLLVDVKMGWNEVYQGHPWVAEEACACRCFHYRFAGILIVGSLRQIAPISASSFFFARWGSKSWYYRCKLGNNIILDKLSISTSEQPCSGRCCACSFVKPVILQRDLVLPCIAERCM
jgi:hypothetical protein